MYGTLLSHLYLTELIGLVVYDLRGRRIGKIQDAALLPLVDAARVDRFLVGGGWTWLSIRHDQVASISLDGIRLRDEVLTPYHADEYMLRLVRDLLDQQIIDAQGRKVVRVTDVTFQIREGRELAVMEVDIGIRSVFRRLFQGVLPPKWIRMLQDKISVNSIPWSIRISSSPTRSGGFASISIRRCSRRCIRPTWRTSWRNSGPTIAKRCSRRWMLKPPPTR